MHQFDVPITKSAAMDKRTHELNELAGDIIVEELGMQAEEENSQDDLDEEGPCPDNNEGWIDKQNNMSEKEINELEESIQPIRVLLMKVSE